MNKKNRTRLETSLTNEKQVALLVAEQDSHLLASIANALQQKNCKVIIAQHTGFEPIPVDYIILLNTSTIPLFISVILKKIAPRLLYIEDESTKSSQLVYDWLFEMSKKFDIRFLKNSVDNLDASQALRALLTTNEKNKQLETLKKLTSKNKESDPGNSNQPIIHPFRFESIEKSNDLPKKQISQEIVTPTVPIVVRRISASQKKTLQLKAEKKIRVPLPRLSTIPAFLMLIFLTVFTPVILYVSQFALGVQQLAAFANKANTGQIDPPSIEKADVYFLRAKTIADSANKPFHSMGGFPLINSASSLTDSGLEVVQLGKKIIELTDTGRRLSNTLFSQSDISTTDSLKALASSLDGLESILENVEIATTSLVENPLLSLPYVNKYKPPLEEKQKSIKQVSSLLNFTKQIFPAVPSIMSVSGEKTYLVLFQNNMELRPTGGFIGSYGLLKMKNGKMQDIKIYDIYDADGQLNGHVDPPEPLRKYLEQPHWYMRDANFDPDFPASAKQVEWFLQKETGTAVNGVIAVDLTFVKKILDAFGGIYLSDYNETITADNLFLKVQTHVQNGFFPGSTRKKDFLGSLMRQIMFRVTDKQDVKWLQFIQSVKNSLDEKHLLVYFHDTTVQEIVSKSGWTGEIHPVQCVKSTGVCLADYVALNEANLGINKSNGYLSRELTQQVTFEKEQVRRSIKIVYRNNSPGNVFPSGAYKAFLRLMLPKSATQTTMRINNMDGQPDAIDTQSFTDKLSLEKFIEIQPGETFTLSISYGLPVPAENYSYQLMTQKQPGTDNDAMILIADASYGKIGNTNFPSNTTRDANNSIENSVHKRYNSPTADSSVLGTANSGLVSYQTDLSVDRIFSMDLVK